MLERGSDGLVTYACNRYAFLRWVAVKITSVP